MDMKRKTRDIRTWEKQNIYFSTYPPPALFQSLYQYIETRKIEVSATSAPPFQRLHRQRNIFHFSQPSCKPFYASKASRRKQETFLYEYPLHSGLLPTKENAQQNAAVSSMVAILTIENNLRTCASASVTCSWTVLLPSDTHRKPITPITIVLLQFMTYLLTSLIFVVLFGHNFTKRCDQEVWHWWFEFEKS
jgi:hypothetical protein